ncbi:MAG TPA: glycosyltransferase family 39 protein [Gemmatimonadaceae bacterium]|nr:glycosyltransferase family 39 protein [Gemmatimonadaceae bacterium]
MTPSGDVAVGARRPSARVVLAVLLAIAALVALPTLHAGFVYDDTTIIRENPMLRGWSALANVWGSPYWPAQGADVSGLYRPLHVALLATVWNAGGGAPLAFHVYSIVLYALVVALVWRLLRGGVGLAAAAAATLWFATQPLHVETFASAANSSELLVVVFTIALTFAIVRAVTATREPGWRAAVVVALLAAAAVLSKESGLLALPIAALTAWGWTSKRSDSLTAASTLPAPRQPRASYRLWLAGVTAVAAALLARAAVLGAPVARVSIAAPGLDALALPERIAAMMSLWPRIVAMLAWPTSLSPYYGPTLLPPHRTTLATLAALALLATSIIVVVLALRGERRPLVALGWVVLSYLPASNLLTATGQLIADRTLFGATVGVALAVGLVVDRLPRRAAAAAFALVALLSLRNGVESARYASDWSSHRTLWQRLVDSSPTEYRGYQLLGIDARERGDSTCALALLARAFAMEPRDRRTRFEYGQVLYATGRHALAAQLLAPLLRDGDVRREPTFVAMYLDAVGRSRGADGVVAAGSPLLRGEAAPTAALFVGAAHEQLGRAAAADSAYALGLRAAPRDTLLLARRARLEHSVAPQ